MSCHTAIELTRRTKVPDVKHSSVMQNWLPFTCLSTSRNNSLEYSIYKEGNRSRLGNIPIFPFVSSSEICPACQPFFLQEVSRKRPFFPYLFANGIRMAHISIHRVTLKIRIKRIEFLSCIFFCFGQPVMIRKFEKQHMDRSFWLELE
jgi:hypothetical protein